MNGTQGRRAALDARIKSGHDILGYITSLPGLTRQSMLMSEWSFTPARPGHPETLEPLPPC
ncbi:MAG: hypothetical protein QF384_07745, partial [Alphaproteobacteria bacterium]|nr:hypothetical protein [Alphaproteobacteria bacterium]